MSKTIIVKLLVVILALGGAAAGEFSPRSPAQIYQEMNNSEITYSIVFGNPGHSPQHTFTVSQTAPSLDPRLVVIQTPEGTIIQPYAISPAMEEILEEAALLLPQRDYERLLGIYQQAVELDPQFFKAWTNLGDTYYLMGQYEVAIDHFQHALSLNPRGYQEYWFLADAYLHLGEREKALEAITRALVLNPNHKTMVGSLSLILQANGLRVFNERLSYPVGVERVSDELCRLIFYGPEGMNYLSAAMAYASWQMEPKFQPLRDERHGQVFMLLEIFLGQYQTSLARRAGGETLSVREEWLIGVIEAGYLNEMILWEMILPQHPELILAQLPDVLDRVGEYITNFVYH